jgi:hypothetical protein
VVHQKQLRTVRPVLQPLEVVTTTNVMIVSLMHVQLHVYLVVHAFVDAVDFATIILMPFHPPLPIPIHHTYILIIIISITNRFHNRRE